MKHLILNWFFRNYLIKILERKEGTIFTNRVLKALNIKEILLPEPIRLNIPKLTPTLQLSDEQLRDRKSIVKNALNTIDNKGLLNKAMNLPAFNNKIEPFTTKDVFVDYIVEHPQYNEIYPQLMKIIIDSIKG